MKYSKLFIVILFILANFSFVQISDSISKPKITNGIKITENTGVKIKEVRLYYEDYSPVAEDNIVKVNQKVLLTIEFEPKSWVEKNGFVSVGASEKIITNKGQVILDDKDLFANLKDIKAVDAEYITLKAVITNNDDKLPYFKIHFTVWDKWGKGKITGFYKLNIANELSK